MRTFAALLLLALPASSIACPTRAVRNGHHVIVVHSPSLKHRKTVHTLVQPVLDLRLPGQPPNKPLPVPR
jgi:hypothetical protein